MDVVYRVRPANEFTIAELKEPYLWFSRPVGFKGDRMMRTFVHLLMILVLFAWELSIHSQNFLMRVFINKWVIQVFVVLLLNYQIMKG